MNSRFFPRVRPVAVVVPLAVAGVLSGCVTTSATQPASSRPATTAVAPSKVTTPARDVKSATHEASSSVTNGLPPQKPATYKPTVPKLTARTPGGQLVNTCVPKRLWNDITTLTTKDGKHLSTLIIGKGPNVVYFGHQYGGQICNFLDLAEQMVKRGYRVMLPEFRGYVASEAGTPSSPLDMRAAFDKLKALKTEHVFLVGASCGGTTAVTEGVRSDIPIAGLTLLSSPARCDGDAVAAVKKIKQPSLFMVAKDDMQGAHEKQLREVYNASPAKKKQFIVVDGEAHGTLMLYGDKAADKRRAKVIGFLADTFSAALRM
ncbi:alpha/beta hydrolase family protein [Streptomyces liangshanensis]|uniref:Alpha/beta hydrolase n=1 Tax=Streptomyces liangshanensis TaxID=2717324 RepID=A0A6G9GYN2_9ACTN|nr:alpha/beta fold hydrolase [Streptomyces liangshanensis]QIQ03166.1 alpha/beta hydrolase [Streptomyces liangshanensis]